MSYTQRIAWEGLRSVTGNGTYIPLGGALLHPAYIIKMVNTSDADALVSIDGVNPIDICPAESFWLYDEGKVGMSSAMPSLPQGTQIHVNAAAPGNAGKIYLVVQYIITN